MKVLKYKRGQIWWYKMATGFDGSTQGKTRPVIIISNDLANANSRCLIGIPCTTSNKRKDMPTHVDIDILGTISTILCENMMSLSTDKLENYIGTLDDEALDRVEKCMRIAIGLEQVVKMESNLVLHHMEQPNAWHSDKIVNEVVTNDVESESVLKYKRSMTDEEKLRFLHDYENHDKEFMLKKYQIKNIGMLYRKIYLIRKEFGIEVKK